MTKFSSFFFKFEAVFHSPRPRSLQPACCLARSLPEPTCLRPLCSPPCPEAGERAPEGPRLLAAARLARRILLPREVAPSTAFLLRKATHRSRVPPRSLFQTSRRRPSHFAFHGGSAAVEAEKGRKAPCERHFPPSQLVGGVPLSHFTTLTYFVSCFLTPLCLLTRGLFCCDCIFGKT